MVLPAYFTGEQTNTALFEKKGCRLIYKNQELLDSIDGFLLYYILTDLQKALTRYEKFVTWSLSNLTTHIKKFNFSAYTAAMFIKLAGFWEDQIILYLTKEHPLYNGSGSYSMEKLYDHHYSVAETIAGKPDKRGNTGYMDRFHGVVVSAK